MTILGKTRRWLGLDRTDESVQALLEFHQDLVRQVGLQQAATQKQFVDLRAIVAQNDAQARQKPLAARSMADIRRFTEGDEA